MNPNSQYPVINQNSSVGPVSSAGFSQPPLQPQKVKPPIGFIIALVIVILLLVFSVVLAVMFYSQMQDYKLNSDQKSAAAVAVAKKAQEEELNKAFIEKEKEPLKSYTSPTASGSVSITYPKTWSAYVNEQSTGNVLDAFFNPNFVPYNSGSSDGTAVALRAQMLSTQYSAAMNEYNAKVTQGKIKAVPFKPEKVPSATVGVRLDGEIIQGRNGSMVVIPVRDKTLKIWTEGTSNVSDFNNFVLKNLTFSP